MKQAAVFFILLINLTAVQAQVEKYEKVLLTRYFKPQVTYSVMTSPEFRNLDLKKYFDEYINGVPKASDDFRNFISFRKSSRGEISYINFNKIPSNPLVPDKGLTSMLKTYFKFLISPAILAVGKNKKNKIMRAVNSQMGDFAQGIAKERVLQIWGYNNLGYFDYNVFLNEAKRNSNDLEDFVADNAAISNGAYKDLMVELVNRNFIIVYNLRECLDFNEYYLAKDIPEYRKLNKNGINVVIEAYIFKIYWTKEDQINFFENCWFDNASNNDKTKSLQAINQMKVNVELVDIVGDEATKQYFKLADSKEMGLPGQGGTPFIIWNPIKHERSRRFYKKNNYNEYLKLTDVETLEGVVNNVHADIRLNVDHFKLRSILAVEKGYKSRIGEKESLYRNQRFVAYDLRQKANGEVKKSYKGVLFSKLPVNNQIDKSLKTNFRQERGFRLRDGMIMEEQPLSLYGFSFSYLYPQKALQDTSTNFVMSLGFINLNYSRLRILKGIYIDPFGVELSRKNDSTLVNSQLLIPSWRPSITRNIFIPRFPYFNLNVGLSFNTMGITSLIGLTPFAGISIPVGAKTSIQINANNGFALSNTAPFETYDDATETSYVDLNRYNNSLRRINGLSFEAKILYTPNKRINQSLKDKKVKI